MSHEGRFANSFHTWLEANGVTIGDPVPVAPSRFNPSGMAFASEIDLNTLKIGVIGLITAAGGDPGRLPDFEDEVPVILIPSETGPDSGPAWQWPDEPPSDLGKGLTEVPETDEP